MKKILIVRHGETFQNRGRVVQGSDPTYGRLTEKGFQQAKLLGEALVDHPVDIVFCSPLERAVLTMSHLLNPRKGERTVPIVFADDLKEVNLGVLQGRPHSEWKAVNNNNAMDHAPEGGESWLDVQRRTSAYFREHILPSPHQNILVVAHGGVNRGIISDAIGITMGQAWEGRGVGTPQDNTCVNILEYNGNDELKEVRVNDTTHLIGHYEEASAGQLWQAAERTWKLLGNNGSNNGGEENQGLPV